MFSVNILDKTSLLCIRTVNSESVNNNLEIRSLFSKFDSLNLSFFSDLPVPRRIYVCDRFQFARP